MNRIDTHTNLASTKLKRKILVMITVVLFLSPYLPAANDCVSYTNHRLYHIYHSGYSYNKNITTMTSLELNIPLTESWPDCKVSNLTISGDDVTILKNTEGPGQVARIYFQNGHPVKGRTVSVQLDYDVELCEVNIDYNALASRVYPEYQKTEEYPYYTALRGGLNYEHKEFCSVIKELKANSGNHPVKYAKEAFDWVAKNIKYGACPPDANSNTVTFDSRCGDCGAFADIFVNLCRGGGIPARFIAGCWAGGLNGWHCWAEFMLPDGTWIPIDHSPAGGFGHLSNNHLPLAKAGCMKFDTDKGTHECGFIQPGYWFFFLGGGSEGSNIDTGFTVESFAWDEMPKIAKPSDIKIAAGQAREAVDSKKYEKAIQIYRSMLLSKVVPSSQKDIIHYKLAGALLMMDHHVKASLELLPLIGNETESILKSDAEKLLQMIRNKQ